MKQSDVSRTVIWLQLFFLYTCRYQILQEHFTQRFYLLGGSIKNKQPFLTMTQCFHSPFLAPPQCAWNIKRFRGQLDLGSIESKSPVGPWWSRAARRASWAAGWPTNPDTAPLARVWAPAAKHRPEISTPWSVLLKCGQMRANWVQERQP